MEERKITLYKIYKNDRLVHKGKLKDSSNYIGIDRKSLYDKLRYSKVINFKGYQVTKVDYYKLYGVYDIDDDTCVCVGEESDVINFLDISTNTFRSWMTRYRQNKRNTIGGYLVIDLYEPIEREWKWQMQPRIVYSLYKGGKRQFKGTASECAKFLKVEQQSLRQRIFKYYEFRVDDVCGYSLIRYKPIKIYTLYNGKDHDLCVFCGNRWEVIKFTGYTEIGFDSYMSNIKRKGYGKICGYEVGETVFYERETRWEYFNDVRELKQVRSHSWISNGNMMATAGSVSKKASVINIVTHTSNL